MKKLILLITACALFLAGCNVLKPLDANPTGTDPQLYETNPVDVEFETDDDYLFTDKDDKTDYSESDSAVITMSGSSVTCNASSVQISGTTVTITKEGTYILRGSLDNGSIVIAAGEKDKPHLIFEGVSIASTSSAAVYVRSADKVFVTLAEGTENTLSNGGSFTPDGEINIDGVIYSKQDLTINGSGSLTVTSPAGHGIVCNDDLAITGGAITIHSASRGLDANDSVRIKDGNLTIDAGKDGIHVEDADDDTTGFMYLSGGTVTIEAEGDGISAALHMQISGGTLEILAGGGYENGESHSSSGWGDFMGGGMKPPGGQRPRGGVVATVAADDASTSMKGLKAGAGILINGGTITIDSADDGIHSNDVAVINGGQIQISSGDDGIHADTELNITDGTITIDHSYEGLEAQNILISGGDTSLIATDDGLNAAGGVDGSGEGGRDQMIGGRPGGMGGGASNGSITIAGGKLYIESSGDGMDANGYLQITGGFTMVCGPNSGDTATLDYDTSGTITGGVFIGTGASGMAQSFSSGSQGVLATRVSAQSANTTVTVTDSKGTELVSFQPKLAFSVFIYSAPELVSGESYHVVIGSVEGDIKAS